MGGNRVAETAGNGESVLLRLGVDDSSRQATGGSLNTEVGKGDFVFVLIPAPAIRRPF
jgi:hypothetical protein